MDTLCSASVLPINLRRRADDYEFYDYIKLAYQEYQRQIKNHRIPPEKKTTRGALSSTKLRAITLDPQCGNVKL